MTPNFQKKPQNWYSLYNRCVANEHSFDVKVLIVKLASSDTKSIKRSNRSPPNHVETLPFFVSYFFDLRGGPSTVWHDCCKVSNQGTDQGTS
jgi:hypothetical protein